MAPWATAGSISSTGTGARATSTIPSRRSPAIARNVAAATPSWSLRIRVCTLPRNSTTRRSGRRAISCARRRSDDVPTEVPAGRSASPPSPSVTNASRTSSRGRKQSITRPRGWSVGMSFIECTARSIAPDRRSSSISRVKRPLPPISLSGRSVTRSPVVRIATTSNAASGRSWAAASRVRVSCAWARARGEPRVPIRSGREGDGRSIPPR